ncbi:PadR family transcriptional regulator [Acidisoma sp. C75]
MFGHHRHRCEEGWARRFARDEALGPEGHGPGGRHHGRHGRHAFFKEGGFGDGRGRGRFFEQGQLRLVILALIAEAPRHGYEVIKAIEDRLGGGYSPSPGVIYPTLTLLSELGYATVSETEAGRKLYSITPEGAAYLSENKPLVEAIFARIERASASAEAGRPPQILRAVENLKTAMRLRLGRGGLSAAEVDAIADALDQAARAIEKA